MFGESSDSSFFRKAHVKTQKALTRNHSRLMYWVDNPCISLFCSIVRDSSREHSHGNLNNFHLIFFTSSALSLSPFSALPSPQQLLYALFQIFFFLLLWFRRRRGKYLKFTHFSLTITTRYRERSRLSWIFLFLCGTLLHSSLSLLPLSLSLYGSLLTFLQFFFYSIFINLSCDFYLHHKYK